jgi:prephenate dehydratase
VFTVRDEVGILSHMLWPFATHGIDLIKIESRPYAGVRGSSVLPRPEGAP